jgi:DNA primase
MDPDEVVLRNPGEWESIVNSAKPIIVHVMDTLVAGQNVDDPFVKNKIAEQVLPLIEDVVKPFEREDYRQRLARLLRVDERSLIGAGTAPAARPTRRRFATKTPEAAVKAQAPAVQVVRAGQTLETHCIRLLLRNPEAIYKLDRSLLRASLGRFSPQDFESTDYQMLVRLVLQSLEQEDMEPLPYIRENLPDSLRDLANDLLSPILEGEPTPEKLIEDLAFTLLRLRLLHVNDNLRQIRFVQEEMQQTGDQPLEVYSDMVMQLTLLRNRLDKALRSPGQTE